MGGDCASDKAYDMEVKLLRPRADVEVIGREAIALMIDCRGISLDPLRVYLSETNCGGTGERHCFALAMVGSIAFSWVCACCEVLVSTVCDPGMWSAEAACACGGMFKPSASCGKRVDFVER